MKPKEDQPNPLDRQFLTAEEAFELLRIDRGTGYKAIREGTFPLPVIRMGRIIRIPTAALLKVFNSDDKSENGEKMQEAR